MLKDITTYALVSVFSVACLGMLAIVMLRETIKGDNIGPFDEWSRGKIDYIKKET